MKFYKLPNNKWTTISNDHSKYWEIKMGYYKYENIEISRPHLEGFGWSNAEKITLNKKQFIEYLRIHEKAHRIMLLRIQKALAELMR